MAFTTQELTASVRRLLGDAAEPYRWGDAEICGYLQAALDRLATLAPHARYVGGVLRDRLELPDGEGEEVPASDRYAEALALYAAHLCYRLDDPDMANAELSGTYLARAEGMMRGG